MNIIIVGCGKVGETLAIQLSEDENNLTVVDIDSSRVNDVVSKCDAMGIIGNGATHATLIDADISNADLLIAVTASDELNLLCCLIAKKAGNCQTIARVRNPEYSKEAPYLKEELALAMVINPEQTAAEEIARVLRFPSAIKIDTFAKGKVEIMKFRLPEDSVLAGCAVKDISKKFGCDVLVCTVERGEDEAYIANGDFVFEGKDVVSIIASPKNANVFFKKIEYKTNSVKNAMIAGGGEITHYLAQILTRSGIDVMIIEKNEKRCEELSAALDDVTVIHGDAAEKELLLGEGLESAGAFLSLTNLDEENILLSLFAKSVCKGKLVTKINRIDFDDVIKSLELDTVIYPKNITAEHIVRYVRAMKNTIGSNVETLFTVIKGKVEAAEFAIKENSPIINIPLMDLKFNANVLIAAISRKGKIIVPRGSDTILPGDSVIIVSDHLGLTDIKDILR